MIKYAPPKDPKGPIYQRKGRGASIKSLKALEVRLERTNTRVRELKVRVKDLEEQVWGTTDPTLKERRKEGKDE